MVPFSRLKSAVVVYHKKNAFEVLGTFTLGASSNGIAPLTKNVQLSVGDFFVNIPPDSFKKAWFGGFVFTDPANKFGMEIQPLSRNNYVFAANKAGATPGSNNPAVVTLTIGDDSGHASAPVYILP